MLCNAKQARTATVLKKHLLIVLPPNLAISDCKVPLSLNMDAGKWNPGFRRVYSRIRHSQVNLNQCETVNNKARYHDGTMGRLMVTGPIFLGEEVYHHHGLRCGNMVVQS